MAIDMSQAQKSGRKAPPPTAGNSGSTRNVGGSTEKVYSVTAQKRIEHRAAGLMTYFQMGSFGLMILRRFADVGAIARHGEKIAMEAGKVAEEDESMAKGLDFMAKTGPYAGLLGASIPLIAQLLVNYKFMPAEAGASIGAVHPEMLEAQVKADLARQAADAIREQQEAEAEMEEALRASQPEPEPPMDWTQEELADLHK